nr:transglutaminase N-terminal domain-containing protein [Pseudomonas aeruginosa]
MSAPALRSVPLQGARYQVLHDTHYRYATPVSLSRQLAHLWPRECAWQACHERALLIEPGAEPARGWPRRIRQSAEPAGLRASPRGAAGQRATAGRSVRPCAGATDRVAGMGNRRRRAGIFRAGAVRRRAGSLPLSRRVALCAHPAAIRRVRRRLLPARTAVAGGGGGH